MVLPQAMAWVQYWFRILSLKFCGKSKKKLRRYISAISRFLHVWDGRTDGRRKVENRAMFWIESETAIMEKYSCTRIRTSSCYTSEKKKDFCILFYGSGPTEPRPPALLWSIYLTTLTTLTDHRFIKKIITELTLLSWSSYVDFLFFFSFHFAAVS